MPKASNPLTNSWFSGAPPQTIKWRLPPRLSWIGLKEETPLVNADFADQVADPDAIPQVFVQTFSSGLFPDVLKQAFDDHRHHQTHVWFVCVDVVLDMLERAVEAKRRSAVDAAHDMNVEFIGVVDR